MLVSSRDQARIDLYEKLVECLNEECIPEVKNRMEVLQVKCTEILTITLYQESNYHLLVV